MPERILNQLKKVMPDYSILPLAFAVFVNFSVYGGAKLLASGLKHHNIASILDDKIPFIPQFLVIYVGCYLFWIVNYILIARQDKEKCYQFFTADFLSRIICLFFFLVYPTTNLRPDVSGPGFWNHAMSILYALDSPVNLFPSIHCLVSWFCWIGIRRDRNVPLWYRRFSCLAAVLVFISTLTVKQHVIIDVAGAVVLAECCRKLGQQPVLWKAYGRIFDNLSDLLLHGRQRNQRSQYHEA